MRPADRGRLERYAEHLVDRHREVELHRVTHLCGNVIQVAPVALREDHVGESRRMRRQHLLLDAADRQHPALQRDLTGHANGVAHRPVAE